MPVIIKPGHLDVWLHIATDPKMLESLLAPFDGALTTESMSKAVNNPRNDSLHLIHGVME